MLKKMLAIGLVLIFGIIGCSFNVEASEGILSEEVKQEIRDNLTELSIPIETQEELIEKLESGKSWDCMKDENVEKFNSMEFNFSPENQLKRMVFEDGSVLQQTINFEDNLVSKKLLNVGGEIRPFSAMRSVHNDVKISISNGLCGGGFYATYVIDWNAHNDGILSVRDPYCNVIGGDYSEMSVTINRSFENYSKKKPAEATYSSHISYIGKLGGAETLILKMYVGNDKMVSGKLGKVSISY